MPLGTELGLSLGDIVLDVDPALPRRGTVPLFLAHVYCGQTDAHLSSNWTLCLRDISPTRHFTYDMDTSPTGHFA